MTELTPIEKLFGKAVAEQLVIGQSSALMLELIYNQLDAIKNVVSPKLSEFSFYVTVPDGGGRWNITPGATTVDFMEGTITDPAGKTTNLRLGLRGRNVDEMRSLMFVTSDDIKISLDGQGKFDLEAGEKFAIAEYGFKTIYLESKVSGTIKLMASTSPSFTVFYDKYFAAELQTAMGPIDDTVYDTELNKPQMVELDLGTMRRMLVEGYGIADKTTTFTMETSDDYVHWFTVESEKGKTYSFGGGNTKRYIRLSSAAAGIAGDLVSLTLSAVR